MREHDPGRPLRRSERLVPLVLDRRDEILLPFLEVEQDDEKEPQLSKTGGAPLKEPS